MLPFPDIEKIAEPPRQAAGHAGAWWWWVAAIVLGLILLGIIIGIIVTISRRAALPGAPGRPDKLALREIKALRRQADTLPGPAFGTALTEILRTFLHRRLGLPARFATTQELLGRSRREDEPPPPPVLVAFASVMEGCDALKFSSSASSTAQTALLDAAEAAIKSLAAAEPPRILTVLPTDPSHAIPA